MKARIGIIGGVLVAAVLSGLLCTNNPVAHNGSGSSTETAVVAGVLYNNDGSFARNAKVTLRMKNSLADTSAILSKTLAAHDSATATTNDSGKFVIDSVDTGTYVIEGTDGGNNLARNDSVPVRIKDSTVTLPPDTLKPAGAIKGVIKLSEGGDPQKVFVLAFGINRFASPNADGSFKLSALAEGKYDLRLISSLDNYGVLDTVNISVKSADTTNLDTISLPFTGIPTPKNVAINYDTLKQIVTLSWSRPDSNLVKGFNVYRRNVDSNTVLKQINTTPITDTVYKDSTGVQDLTYEYRVAAVNTNATEGTKSAGVSILLSTYFKIDTSFGGPGTGPAQFENLSGIAGDFSGNIYVGDRSQSRIQVFNNNMAYQFEIDSPQVSSPWGIAVDSLKNIFSVVSHFANMIKKFNSNGNLIDSFVIGTGSHEEITDICIHGNNLFVVFRHDSVSAIDDSLFIMDLNGHRKRAWPVFGAISGDIPGYVSVNNSNKVFLSGNYSIQSYDTLGNIGAVIAPAHLNLNGKSIFDSKGRMIVVQNASELWIFNNQGQVMAKYNFQKSMGFGNDNEGGAICASQVNGNSLIYIELAGTSNKILRLINLLP